MDPAISVLGLGVGVVYGVFGAGGSAFATPVLALLGVPALAAIASPLPATIPGAAAGAWAYRQEIDTPVLAATLAGATPAVIVGAMVAPRVPGSALLVLSGLLLLSLGARLVVVAPAPPDRSSSRRRPALLVPISAAIGFLTGLLANSGGFLLVPMFILLVGLDPRRAAGTSLLAAAVLSVPTLIVHTALGDVDWVVAATFAVGLVPGAAVGGRWAHHLPMEVLQRLFGAVLVAFAIYFLARQGLA